MSTNRIYFWFGDEVDSASPPAAVATTTSSGGAPTNGVTVKARSRDFNAASDQAIILMTKLPADYSSGGALVIDWFTTGTTNAVVWKTAFVLIHPASEGTPTDLDAASFGTVTAGSPVTVPGTAGYSTETTLSLGITGGHPGDKLLIMLGRDADNGSDTLTVDAKLEEPIAFTYTAP